MDNSETSPFIYFENPVHEKDYKFLGFEEIHPIDVYNHWIPAIGYSVDSLIFPLDEQTNPPALQPEPPIPVRSFTSPAPKSKPRQVRRSRKYRTHGKLMTREDLIKDEKWNWRKYGQKSIQGSPYPRHYYRCSTLKECNAKMYLEIKTPGDPIIYEIYYSGEHNHARPIHRPLSFTRTRNHKKPIIKSCAKPLLPTQEELSPPQQGPFVPSSYSPMEGSAGKETNTDSEIFYYNEEEFKIELIPNAIVMEDTFMGLQELGIMNPSFMTQLGNNAATGDDH